MKKVTITLKSLSPYTQSRMHSTPKLEKENPADYEDRTWREKCTTDENDNIVIPPIAFKMALDKSSKMLGMQIPNRGKSTYSKHFLAGIMAPVGITLPIKKNDAKKISINANSDGVRGSGKRVVRHFPQVESWSGEIEMYVVDDTVTESVFEKHMQEAGKLVGIGQYRPENGGTCGRFRCEKFVWSDLGD